MKLVTLLFRNERIFVEDAVEDKKTRALVADVNNQCAGIVELTNQFEEFARSQMEGEYHERLVMAKSLMTYYSSWIPMKLAYAAVEREEAKKLQEFANAKDKLVNTLKLLLKESEKTPVVCAYDVFENSYEKCPEGHTVIVLGQNNRAIIETMITSIEEGIKVKGNFEKVKAKELTANYANVTTNVANCLTKTAELFASKQAKLNKISSVVSQLEQAGKTVVFFMTYKDWLKAVGVDLKELANYEKQIAKEYIPLKKLLIKTLKVQFVDICDTNVNEAEYETAQEALVDENAEVVAEPAEVAEEPAEAVETADEPTIDSLPEVTEEENK